VIDVSSMSYRPFIIVDTFQPTNCLGEFATMLLEPQVTSFPEVLLHRPYYRIVIRAIIASIVRNMIEQVMAL
jgi:hypothetical protein